MEKSGKEREKNGEEPHYIDKGEGIWLPGKKKWGIYTSLATQN